MEGRELFGGLAVLAPAEVGGGRVLAGVAERAGDWREGLAVAGTLPGVDGREVAEARLVLRIDVLLL